MKKKNKTTLRLILKPTPDFPNFSFQWSTMNNMSVKYKIWEK